MKDCRTCQDFWILDCPHVPCAGSNIDADEPATSVPLNTDKLLELGYSLDDLDRSNPFNQWMFE